MLYSVVNYLKEQESRGIKTILRESEVSCCCYYLSRELIVKNYKILSAQYYLLMPT